MAKMSFDPEIAKDVGVNCAIMYANLEFWCQKNAANDKHFYDGHYWTYNSMPAFETLFPWWSYAQVRRILENLEKNGYILCGSYNKSPYDKTKWYAVLKSNISICDNKHLDLLKVTDRTAESSRPIPDNKHRYKNTDSADAFNRKKAGDFEYVELSDTPQNPKYDIAALFNTPAPGKTADQETTTTTNTSTHDHSNDHPEPIRDSDEDSQEPSPTIHRMSTT